MRPVLRAVGLGALLWAAGLGARLPPALAGRGGPPRSVVTAKLRAAAGHLAGSRAGGRAALGRWGQPDRRRLVGPRASLIARGRGEKGPPLAAPQAAEEYQRILGRLGITAENSAAPRDEWTRELPEKPMGLGLARTIELLKTRPYLHREVLFRPEARNATARYSIDQSYSPLRDPHVRLSDDATYQRRVGAMHGQLGGIVKQELGVDPGSFSSGIAVLEGGRADTVNAVTFRNGSIVVHRRMVDLTEQLGAALAASRDKQALLGNVLAVADGSFRPPPGLDAEAARRYADGALAMVVGHEMTHGMKFHSATGTPAGRSEADVARAQRAKEAVSDAGGINLATRAGYSPLGQAAIPLVFAMFDVLGGHLGRSEGVHPSGLERYGTVFRYLETRRGAARPLYDGQRSATRGGPLLGPGQLAELDRLPSPQELRAFAERSAGQARPSRGRAPLVAAREIPHANPPHLPFTLR